jgi:hypothetical protein
MYDLVKQSYAEQGIGPRSLDGMANMMIPGPFGHPPPPLYPIGPLPPGMFNPSFFSSNPGGPMSTSQFPPDLQSQLQAALPEGDIAYATADPSLTINPSTLSGNGSTSGMSMSSGPPGPSNPGNSSAPSSTSAPSTSPTLSTKQPANKKGGMPSSPTKAQGGADKDKNGGKRRNNSDTGEGPPLKRRAGRKSTRV